MKTIFAKTHPANTCAPSDADRVSYRTRLLTEERNMTKQKEESRTAIRTPAQKGARLILGLAMLAMTGIAGIATAAPVEIENPGFEDPVLPAVRHAPVRYIGALSSRRTSADRAKRLRAAGWTDDEIARIHAPIGIDIGAEQPSEVAVSILAEIIRVRYGAGTGMSLRGVEGRIHPQRGEEEGTT